MADPKVTSRLDAHRALRDRASWIKRLSEACATTIAHKAFVDPHQTADLKRRFFERVGQSASAERLFLPVNEMDRAVTCLDGLGRRLSGDRVLLFHSMDAYLGAVALPAAAVLRNAVKVWDVVGEDLCIATEDISSGLCLEKNWYDDHGEHSADGVLELTTWGKLAVR